MSETETFEEEMSGAAAAYEALVTKYRRDMSFTAPELLIDKAEVHLAKAFNLGVDLADKLNDSNGKSDGQEELVIGDVVTLKSDDTIKMTVTRVNDKPADARVEPNLECTWFNARTDDLKTGRFPALALQRVSLSEGS